MADYAININVNTQPTQASFKDLVDVMNQVDNSVKSVKDALDAKSAAARKGKQSIDDYRGSYFKLNEELKKNNETYSKQLVELKKIEKQYGKGSDQVKNQERALIALNTTIKQQTSLVNQYNAALNKTTTSSNRLNSATSGLIKTFNSLGSVLGISFGIYGAFRVIQSATKAVAEFDLAQKKLQSILATNNAGMKEIRASAIEVGKASIFGAAGVTELQIELAKMGFAKDEIIAMQSAVVNLATATQEELAPSAEVVANIIRAFQLTASDATMVVDVMGKAFNDSALDLSNFRESIKYVAPIAKQANFSFAETVSLLEQLSNAGIKGSLAGTGLTNIISRLGNENSKFVKTLGRTVNGFDDFLVALVELNNRGVDLTDVFQLVDRRAAATFSILLEGVSTVEEFRKKLEESSGVMKEQAGVQLESLTYQSKLLKESWKAMIIEMDDSSNVITGLAKAFLNLGNAIVIALGEPQKRIFSLTNTLQEESAKMIATYKDFGFQMSEDESKRYNESLIKTRDYYIALSNLESEYKKNAFLASKLPAGVQGIATARLKTQLNADINALTEEFKGTSEELSAVLSDVTEKSLKPYVDEFVRLAETTGNLSKADEIQRGRLLELQKLYPKGSLQFEFYGKAIDKVIAKYDELNKTGLGVGGGGEEGKADDKAKRLLELQKQIALEEIKAMESGAQEKIKIAEETYKKDVDLAYLTIQDQEERNLQLKLLDDKRINAVREAYGEMKKIKSESYAWELTSEKEITKKFLEEAENRIKGNKDLIELLLGADKGEKNADSNIWSKLGITDENTQKALDESFKLAKDGITDLADEWVTQTDRIVEARNNMVDEAQQALETEIQLAEQGFANNVTLKRKELEEAKKLRQKALEDQRKAQKAQAALDLAQTTSSLIVAAAQIFGQSTKLGILGVPIGIGLVVSMIAAMAKFRTQIQGANAASKYEKGGWIGGKRHSQGGTMIEAETGEFVINRKSASKYKPMIEAINIDDTFSLNRMYLNNLKNGVLNAKVSLDDSQDLKAIRKVLESQGRSVEYTSDGYRIERNGNVTTRIRLN